MDKKIRQSNIELLRILAMFMIVLGHSSFHSEFVFGSSFSVNRIWTQFTACGGNWGLNLFGLITGYFLIKNSNNIISKALRFMLQTLTYSFGIYIILLYKNSISFNPKQFISFLFPLLFDKWWYASAYFFLLMCSPVLNRMVLYWSKKEFTSILVFLTINWVIVPTVLLSKSYAMSGFFWCFYLYLIGAYIQCHVNLEKVRMKYCLIGAFGAFFLTLLFIVTFNVIGIKYPELAIKATYVNNKQDLLIVMGSIFLFLSFLKWNVSENRLINKTASAMFGVYLIHEHELVYSYLWNSLFCLKNFAYSQYLFLYHVVAAVLVLMICSAIELLRQTLFEGSYKNVLPVISIRLEHAWEDLNNEVGVFLERYQS